MISLLLQSHNDMTIYSSNKQAQEKQEYVYSKPARNKRTVKMCATVLVI